MFHYVHYKELSLQLHFNETTKLEKYYDDFFFSFASFGHVTNLWIYSSRDTQPHTQQRRQHAGKHIQVSTSAVCMAYSCTATSHQLDNFETQQEQHSTSRDRFRNHQNKPYLTSPRSYDS